MPLHPQAEAILEVMQASGVLLGHDATPEESRRTIEAFAAATRDRAPVHRVADRTIPGPAGDIPVRVYRPRDEPGLPVLVWFHGGGWVIGSLETHDATMRLLTNAVGCVTVSVDYRLAPEHRFPAAVDDAYAATRWIAQHAADLGGDPARVAIGGDSAGGNLTAVVSLLARDDGATPLVSQVLVYPATDRHDDRPALRENAEGYFLEAAGIEWFYGHYLGPDEPHRDDWRVSPLRAPDLSGLPPATVLTAEFDPLRDQGIAYAKRLADAGVAVESRCVEGVFHGFFGMQDVLEPAREGFDVVVSFLQRAFEGA